MLNLRDDQGRDRLALLTLTGLATRGDLARLLDLPEKELATLWGDLPLDDRTIARRFDLTPRQVINLRKSARARLARRLRSQRSPPRAEPRPCAAAGNRRPFSASPPSRAAMNRSNLRSLPTLAPSPAEVALAEAELTAVFDGLLARGARDEESPAYELLEAAVDGTLDPVEAETVPQSAGRRSGAAARVRRASGLARTGFRERLPQSRSRRPVGLPVIGWPARASSRPLAGLRRRGRPARRPGSRVPAGVPASGRWYGRKGQRGLQPGGRPATGRAGLRRQLRRRHDRQLVELTARFVCFPFFFF